MSHIYIPYQSLHQLIDIFQNTNVPNFAINPMHRNNPNFILINPEMYYGSYGGLLIDDVIRGYETDCVSENVGDNLSIVWWFTSLPIFVGDICALTYENRVAVTPSMFKEMQLDTIRKPKAKNSSYFTNKAWRINSESTSY